VGKVHTQNGELTQLGILSTGRFDSPTWRPEDPTAADFFTLKGTLEQIAANLNLPPSLKRTTSDPRLHPTRQAKLLFNGIEVGIFGQIHPLVAEQSSLPPTTVLAELTLDPLRKSQGGIPTYHPISRNPAARRDIAILVKKEVMFVEIESAIQTAGGPDLERFWLFDVYEGQGVPDGSHSLAIALQFRRMNANLTDEDANALRDHIVTALTALGATLR
jgi:phenylalanyl-tRNA synthetase beta chain